MVKRQGNLRLPLRLRPAAPCSSRGTAENPAKEPKHYPTITLLTPGTENGGTSGEP